MGRRARFAVRGTTASHSGQSCQNDVFDQLFIDDVHTEGGGGIQSKVDTGKED